MNGVTNNTNTTQTTQEPTIVPVAEPQITSSAPQQPQAPQTPPPAPVVQPQVEQPAAPAANSLGDNVVIAPPQEGPINASNGTPTAPKIVAQTPTTPQIEETPEEVKEETPIVEENTVVSEPPKKGGGGKFFIFLIFLALIGLNVYQYLNNEAIIKKNNFECTPVTTYETEKELDVNSTLVQDLYNKVETNIREDLAHHDFDENLKRYLAFRQMPTKDFYDSNCNYFNDAAMQLYTCPTAKDFHPLAIKVESFAREYKKLFGANTEVPHGNIQLGNKCLGGYQYIPERGEYVQGTCKESVSTPFKKTSQITKAISRNNTIIIYEEVSFKGTDTQTVPGYLKNGIYAYTFRLDVNYNYVYVSRDFTPKY